MGSLFAPLRSWLKSEAPPDQAGGAAAGAGERGVRLDQDLVERVAPLQVRARRAVEGLRSGIHNSPHRGASVIFAEHRDYRPGDNLRLLDWRAYARSDRFTTKHFEQEAHLRAHMVLDLSSSMDYGGGAEHKASYAGTLLAALGLVLLRQGDSVGAFTVAESILGALPARARSDQLELLIKLLDATPAQDKATNLREALTAVAERAGRRSLIALASDLLDPDPNALDPLSLLKARGHDVLVFHVLHRDELALPFDDRARFVDPETGATLETDPAALRAIYRQRMDAFVDSCRNRCVAAGCRYALAPTDQPVQQVLNGALRGGT